MSRSAIRVAALLVIVACSAAPDPPIPPTDPVSYIARYGGELEVYERIFAHTRCIKLMTEIEQAGAAIANSPPDSPESEAAVGYKRAAQDLLQLGACDGAKPVATGASSGYTPPPNFANISGWASTERDCDNLQTWFDGAANMQDRASDASDRDASQWYLDLMHRLDDRMRAVGCYG